MFKEYVSNVPVRLKAIAYRLLSYFKEVGKERIVLVDFDGKYNIRWSILDYLLVGLCLFIVVFGFLWVMIAGVEFAKEQQISINFLFVFITAWLVSGVFIIMYMNEVVKGCVYTLEMGITYGLKDFVLYDGTPETSFIVNFIMCCVSVEEYLSYRRDLFL